MTDKEQKIRNKTEEMRMSPRTQEKAKRCNSDATIEHEKRDKGKNELRSNHRSIVVAAPCRGQLWRTAWNCGCFGLKKNYRHLTTTKGNAVRGGAVTTGRAPKQLYNE